MRIFLRKVIGMEATTATATSKKIENMNTIIIGGINYYEPATLAAKNYVAHNVLAQIFNVIGVGPIRCSKLIFEIGGQKVRAVISGHAWANCCGPTRRALIAWVRQTRPELSVVQADHVACMWINAHKDVVFALDHLCAQ